MSWEMAEPMLLDESDPHQHGPWWPPPEGCACPDVHIGQYLSEVFDSAIDGMDCWPNFMLGLEVAMLHPEWARWVVVNEHVNIGCSASHAVEECEMTRQIPDILVRRFIAAGDPARTEETPESTEAER